MRNPGTLRRLRARLREALLDWPRLCYLRDVLRYGLEGARLTYSMRERERLWRDMRRDPVLRAEVRAHDAACWERGSGVTSSGYIVGSAGEFV